MVVRTEHFFWEDAKYIFHQNFLIVITNLGGQLEMPGKMHFDLRLSCGMSVGYCFDWQ